MIRLVWAVLCDQIITDSETNRVSYIQTIEEAEVRGLPVPLFPFSIGTVWEKIDGDSMRFKLRMSCLGPDAEELSSFESEEFKGKKRHRVNIAGFGGFNINQPGRHVIKLEIAEEGGEWAEATQLPLYINLKEKQAKEKGS